MGSCARLVLAVLVLARVAFADPGDAEYQAGRRHYDLQEWDEAIDAFKKAFAIRADAASLYNIAQSYRLKGDCAAALGFYKTYRRNFPNEKNIATVDELITELEPCAKQQEAQRQAPPPPPPPPPPAPDTGSKASPPPPPPPPARHTSDPGHGTRIAGISIGAFGVGALATGVVFTFAARARANDVTKGGDPTNPPIWDPTVERAGKRDALVAEILIPTGLAAIAGGVILYVTGHTSETTQVSARPTTSGGLLVWHRVW